MSHRVRLLVIAPTLLAVLAAAAIALASGPADAHGGPTDPPTRTYVCRFLAPGSPPCAAAWAAEPQALYDWMEVNIGDAAGRHQQLIPDGRLCSAGRDKYAAFDSPRADWPATPARAGPTTLTYEATAPHATAYFRWYVTRAGWDPTQPLAWADLELVYDSGPLAAAPSYAFPAQLPTRTGRHVLYGIWQRSDSPEAFYSCSDLDFGGGQGPTTTTGGGSTTTTPTTTAPGGPGRAHLPATLTTTADWGAGWCAEGRVTNPGAGPVAWATTIALPGTLTTTWDGAFHAHHGTAHVEGAAWNAVLGAGASTTFGFCADRAPGAPTTTGPATTTTTAPPTTAPPTTTPTTVPPTGPPVVTVTATSTVTDRWSTGRCATATVRNPRTHPITWKANVAATGLQATAVWDARGEVRNGKLVVTGAPWNATLAPGATTTFGYCLAR